MMARRAMIGIETLAQMRRRGLSVARRADAGRRMTEADYHLNFETAAQLFAELTPARLALLQALQDAGACTIYALAKRVERNYSNVYADVKRLGELGLIEYDQARKVFVPWREIRINVALARAA
jgi:predicted transcriptional regulator